MISSTSENKNVRKIVVILFWLAVWQVLSSIIDEEILLVSPLSVLTRLSELIFERDFWTSIANTISKITIGLILATVTGFILGLLSFLFPIIKEFVYPVVLFFKSVPVASFVILILIWIDSAYLSIAISFIMGMPIIYSSVYTGFSSVDKKFSEMADSFKMGYLKRFRYIYFVKVKRFFESGILTSVGLMFKAGVAAEVIGLPKNSIGENLYNAKIYLDMPSLFAWTITIIIFSRIYEQIIKCIFGGSDD
jgi:NitT/TauT family transport system permease protein